MVHSPAQTRPKSPRKRGPGNKTTRQRLLDAAGQVFAEKGFDRATAKEICEQAGINTAAVNYYFGGVDGLYVAVIEEARNRLLSTDALLAAVAGQADAPAKLQAIAELVVRALAGPAASSWVLRVLGREVVSPSPALDALRERDAPLRMAILRDIVGQLMGLPADHPAVARGFITAIAPVWVLMIADRQMLKAVAPDFAFGPEDAASFVRHIVQFALAGLSAVGADVRKGSPEYHRPPDPQCETG